MLDRAVVDNTLRFRQVREQTAHLCISLSPEDCNLQAIPETSPLKWHLAHTTWFFETFILKPFSPGYRVFHDDFQVLFNSYYNGIGKQHPRAQRHLLSRPGLDEVKAYREHVDLGVITLLDRAPEDLQPEIASRLELGLNHEQQHQELMLTDLKYNFSCNPIAPVYQAASAPNTNIEGSRNTSGAERYQGGLVEIGQPDSDAFGFDNEHPRHRVWLEPFSLARHLVTNGEFREFIADGGYERPELWLSDGWGTLQAEAWSHPLYWALDADEPAVFTLHGRQVLRDCDPVCHLSYFEADAFARWRGARLPTEEEWEHAVNQATAEKHGSNSSHPSHLQPTTSLSKGGLQDLFGQVWQWTSSAYRAYPGYRTAPGALGEYNGKFMCNQFVLRGSSCVTPAGHSRATYRNFFYPGDRWQFTGLRLAWDEPGPS